jgi:hypothetical protein
MTQGIATPTLNTVFRAAYYPVTYSAFSSVTLTPTNEIEINPTSPSLCSVATNIHEQENNSFTMYPNPINANGLLEIETTYHKNYTLEVFNLVGQSFIKKEISVGNQKTTLELNNLKPGIYIINMSGQSINVCKKIMVN